MRPRQTPRQAPKRITRCRDVSWWFPPANFIGNTPSGASLPLTLVANNGGGQPSRGFEFWLPQKTYLDTTRVECGRRAHISRKVGFGIAFDGGIGDCGGSAAAIGGRDCGTPGDFLAGGGAHLGAERGDRVQSVQFAVREFAQ